MLEKIIEKAKKNKKKVILTESEDERILKAAIYCQKEGIADIILIGAEKDIYEKLPQIKESGIEIINPFTYKMKNKLVKDLYEMKKDKGWTAKEVENKFVENYMYFACMMLKNEYADAVVSGACHSTSDTLRPALQILKGDELVSAFFLMEKEDNVYLYADSGLVQDPNAEELAAIAIKSAITYKDLVEKEPKVAMLSHSTYQSATHPLVDKVRRATQIAKEKSDFLVDGELQVDAAIVPEVAKIKCPDSPIKGQANILIFPNLDAGNIAYKLTERLGGYKAYGPLTQGLKKVVNDLSRGASIEDIIGVIAISSVQAS